MFPKLSEPPAATEHALVHALKRDSRDEALVGARIREILGAFYHGWSELFIAKAAFESHGAEPRDTIECVIESLTCFEWSMCFMVQWDSPDEDKLVSFPITIRRARELLDCSMVVT